MKSLLFCLFLSLMGVATPVWAQSLAQRCTADDHLTLAQIQGRNAWARGCGYISAAKEAMLNAEGEYQVFSNGCFKYPCSANGCQTFVPVSQYAPCVSGLILFGTCSASLLSPVQQYMYAENFTLEEWLATQPFAAGARPI